MKLLSVFAAGWLVGRRRRCPEVKQPTGVVHPGAPCGRGDCRMIEPSMRRSSERIDAMAREHGLTRRPGEHDVELQARMHDVIDKRAEIRRMVREAGV